MATIFAIIVTDCYLAYKHNELKYHRSVLQYDDFLGKLAKQLIFNPYFDEPRENVGEDDEVIINTNLYHY